MKKHILFVLDYYLPHRWWSETVFEKIINGLIKKWHKITLITSHFDPKLPIQENHNGLHILRVGKGRFSFMFSTFLAGIKLLWKEKNIDVIHTSTYWWAIPASLLGILFRKKVILTVHEIFWKLWIEYKWFFSWLLYLFFEHIIFLLPYDVYHCVSLYTMNSLRVCYWITDSKLCVVYNWVDTDFWDKKLVSESDILDRKKKYWWGGKFVVLYYWHAGKSKWIDTIVDAIPKVLAQSTEIIFVLNIIDSRRKTEIVSRLKDLHMPNRIHIFDGFEKDRLRSLVATADLVVAPSFSEGFGSVHSEATTLGKPLVTTLVASIPEVVWGQVKFIVPGSVQQLVDAILSYKKDQQSFSTLPLKHFDWKDTVDQIERLY